MHINLYAQEKLQMLTYMEPSPHFGQIKEIYYMFTNGKEAVGLESVWNPFHETFFQ